MDAKTERRYLSMADDETTLGLECREGEAPKIRGIAPPWNSKSVDLGGFREVFLSTAFDKFLAKRKVDVPLLFNHDPSQILARTTNGTLRIEKSDKGLAYEGDPVPTADSEKVLTLIRTKTIFGSSFAFTVNGAKGESFEEDERGNITRTISDATLWDVSPVTNAAYPQSTLSARSIDAWRAARRMAEAGGQERGLTISLDYDRTFTAAPGLWRSFVADATARGNRVVCITRRDDTEENRHELRIAFGDLEVARTILCGSATQKRDAAKAAGVEVDVWIDDYPEGIVSADTTPAAARSFQVSTLAGAKAAAAAAVARMRIHAG